MSETALLDPRRPRRTPAVGALLNANLVAASVAVCLLHADAFSWAGGLLLVLLLPGDALRRALRTGVARADPFVFDVAVSIAITVVVGLIADQLSAGLTATSMSVGLAASALASDIAVLVVAALRRDAGPAPLAGARADLRSSRQRNRGYAVAGALFAVPATVAVALALHSAQQHETGTAVTALSIVQSGADRATVRIESQESGRQAFELAVTSAQRDLARQSVTLARNEGLSFAVSAAGVAVGQRITATLTRVGDTTPLRTVWIVAHG